MLFGSRLVTLALAAAVLALAVAYGVFLTAPATGVFHDDSVNLVTAKALAEGHGYHIISLPWAPPQTKYPVLFPWLLSLVWQAAPLFPDNLVWLRLVPLVGAFAWWGLSWCVLRRLETSRPAAATILFLTAVSPWVVFVSTITLSETVFAALLTASVLFLLRIEQERPRGFDAFASGALMSAAMLTRAAGVAPAVGTFIVLVIRRRWRSVATYTSAVVLTYGPWILWVRSQTASNTIDAWYQGSIYSAYNVITDYSWADKIAVVAVNTLYLASVGHYWGLEWSWLGFGVAAIGTPLVLIGLWRQRTTPLAIVVILYLGMLLVFVWPPYRYVVPILPLLIWFAWEGARTRPVIATGLAALLCVTSAVTLTRTAQAVYEKGGTWYSPNRVSDWAQMRRQYDWLAHETPRDAVVVGIHDPNYYLFSGRQAVRPFNHYPILISYNVRGSREYPFGTVAEFRNRLLMVKADYVVLTPRDGIERLTNELLTLAPGSLTLVLGTASSGSLIYRVDRAQLATPHE